MDHNAKIWTTHYYTRIRKFCPVGGGGGVQGCHISQNRGEMGSLSIFLRKLYPVDKAGEHPPTGEKPF